MNAYAIGRASALSGVKVTTIRYYEQIGLMPVPERKESGRRRYDDEDVDRLRFIRHARALGFTVESIRGLLELQSAPSMPCHRADALARSHLAETEARIFQLERLAAELRRMIVSCASGQVEHCAVLATLDDHALCADAEH